MRPPCLLNSVVYTEFFLTEIFFSGLVAMILFILSIFLGVIANYSQKLKKCASPVILKFLHNFFGVFGYIVGVVSLCYSYYSDWFVFYTSEGTRLGLLIATVFGSLWMLNRSFISGYNQIRTIYVKIKN